MIRSSVCKTNWCFSTLLALPPSLRHPTYSLVRTLPSRRTESYIQISKVHSKAGFIQLPLVFNHQLLCLRSFAPMAGGKKNMAGARCSKSDSPNSDKAEGSSGQNNVATKKDTSPFKQQENTNREQGISDNTGARKKTPNTKDGPKDASPRKDSNPPTGGDPPSVDRSNPLKGDSQTDEIFSENLRSTSFSGDDSSRGNQQTGRGEGPPPSDKVPPLKKYVSEGPVVSLPKRTTFEEDWQYLKALPIEEKRKLYTCRKFNTLKDIPTWTQYAKDNAYLLTKHRPTRKMFSNDSEYVFNSELNDKVSLYVGDITSLEINCIVNAANSSLLGGGGVDGAIHRAAGPSLLKECRTLGGCKTGEAKLTRGYKLPAEYVIHTVGPMDSSAPDLYSSYFNSLQLAFLKKIRTIAFPCISTGIYGFPNDQAVSIVLPIIRKILNRNPKQFDRIIFCLFMREDIELYMKYMQVYFPLQEHGAARS